MDWKQGLTAAVVVGLGYFGFRNVRKGVESFSAEKIWDEVSCINCGGKRGYTKDVCEECGWEFSQGWENKAQYGRQLRIRDPKSRQKSQRGPSATPFIFPAPKNWDTKAAESFAAVPSAGTGSPGQMCEVCNESDDLPYDSDHFKECRRCGKSVCHECWDTDIESDEHYYEICGECWIVLDNVARYEAESFSADGITMDDEGMRHSPHKECPDCGAKPTSSWIDPGKCECGRVMNPSQYTNISFSAEMIQYELLVDKTGKGIEEAEIISTHSTLEDAERAAKEHQNPTWIAETRFVGDTDEVIGSTILGAESFSTEYITVKCDSCGKETEKEDAPWSLSENEAFASRRPAKGFRYCPCGEHICDACRLGKEHAHFDRTGCESHDMVSQKVAKRWKKEIAERKAKKNAEKCSVCGSRAVHVLKKGEIVLCDKHYQQQFGKYSAESFSADDKKVKQALKRVGPLANEVRDIGKTLKD